MIYSLVFIGNDLCHFPPMTGGISCLEPNILTLDIRAVLFACLTFCHLWESCRHHGRSFYPYVERFGPHTFPIIYFFPLWLSYMIHDLELTHLYGNAVKECSVPARTFVPAAGLIFEASALSYSLPCSVLLIIAFHSQLSNINL